MSRINLLWSLSVAALLTVAVSHGAAADVVTMDSFSVKGPAGNTFFTDPFNLNGTLSGTGASSGVNTTTGSAVNYNIIGSFTESGGSATLNTANGALDQDAPPFDASQHEVNAKYAGSFTRSGALGATGIFYLSVPTTVGALYGVEFVDLNAGHNGDVAAMRVIETAAGPQIALVNVDFFDNTLSVIESTALDTGHDEIELNLAKASNSNTVTGSFAYIDGGVLGTVTTFVDTTSLANDGAAVLTPGFNALAPVPEPGTLVILGSGLAMLGWSLRRKKRA